MLPDTINVVSLVMKSPAVPVSVVIAVTATASAGRLAMVMAWLAVVPILPAVSRIRA
ncbi:MAG: hypothetical protein WA214_15300 [Pseudolabrys sp.]